MPLFQCSQCKVTENTAVSNYWVDVVRDKKPPLCSQCDPRIGKWHGKFPRKIMEQIPPEHQADHIMEAA